MFRARLAGCCRLSVQRRNRLTFRPSGRLRRRLTQALAAMKLILNLVVTSCLVCAVAVAKDANSPVRGDFNGDGVPDSATLVQHAHEVTAIVHFGGSHQAPQSISFGVGQSQDAVCSLPARLKVVPLSCSADDGTKLSGCIESNNAKGLILTGGECDPINVYWDHQAKRLSWWRN